MEHCPRLTKLAVVLENAGIAWPNPGMWYNAPPGWYSIMSPPYNRKAGYPVTHVQPSKCQMVADDSTPTYNAAAMASQGPSQPFSAPRAVHNLEQQLGDPSWSPSSPMPDPFIDEKTSHEQSEGTGYGSPQHDWSHSATVGNGRIDATNDVPQITVDNEIAPATAESHFDDLMASLIRGEEKTFAAVATGMDTPVHTPSLCSNFSTSPNAKPISFPNEQPRAVPVTICDLPPSGSRESSDVNMALGESERLEPEDEYPVFIVTQTPALIIRSKKEGLGLTRKSPTRKWGNGSKNENGIWAKRGKDEDRRWGQETSRMVGEGKRKQPGNYATSTLLKDISNWSPVYKASRISRKGDPNGARMTEMLKNGADRMPPSESEKRSLSG